MQTLSDEVYDALAQIPGTSVVVRQDRCITVRNRNVTCGLCAQACAGGCIGIEDGRIAVDADRCIGCGTCATACPTCALEAHGPGDAQLLATCERALRESATARSVAIACERATVPEDAPPGPAVEVVCLGRVDESLLVFLAACGARAVELFAGDCAACPHRPGRLTCDAVVQTSRVLLDAWRCPMTIEVRETPRPSVDPDASVTRRLQGGDAVPSEAASARPARRPVRVMADGTLPHFVPDRRERLLDALARLGEPRDGAVLETRLTGHVRVDTTACTSCRLCAVFCPTGAVAKLDGKDGSFGLVHTSGDCVRCLSCEKVCRTHAIHVEPGVTARDLLDCAPQRIDLARPAVPKGTPDAMAASMRALLHMEEVYDR